MAKNNNITKLDEVGRAVTEGCEKNVTSSKKKDKYDCLRLEKKNCQQEHGDERNTEIFNLV